MLEALSVSFTAVEANQVAAGNKAPVKTYSQIELVINNNSVGCDVMERNIMSDKAGIVVKNIKITTFTG